MNTFAPASRPGHTAEHAAGTARVGRKGDPIGGRPASQGAGLTWQSRAGQIFVPFTALKANGRYGLDTMNTVHQALLACDAAPRTGVLTLPPGAVLVGRPGE